jgi:hypothetical protein
MIEAIAQDHVDKEGHEGHHDGDKQGPLLEKSEHLIQEV